MEFIKILNALLTPVIAIFAVYIAYQQYRINKRNSEYQKEIDLQKINLELFNRRYRIFTETKNLILHLSKYAKVDSKRLSDFITATNEHKFLFGREIEIYLNELYEKATNLSHTNNEQKNIEIYPPHSPQRKELLEKHEELLNWFTTEFENCEVRFIKYLNFRNLEKYYSPT